MRGAGRVALIGWADNMGGWMMTDGWERTDGRVDGRRMDGGMDGQMDG